MAKKSPERLAPLMKHAPGVKDLQKQLASNPEMLAKYSSVVGDKGKQMQDLLESLPEEHRENVVQAVMSGDEKEMERVVSEARKPKNSPVVQPQMVRQNSAATAKKKAKARAARKNAKKTRSR